MLKWKINLSDCRITLIALISFSSMHTF